MRQGIVYRYLNTITGESYIGKTIDPTIRHRTHMRDVLNGKGFKFAQAVAEYGYRNFTYSVVWSGSEDAMSRMEDHYIAEYDSIASGYNIANAVSKKVKVPAKRIKSAVSKPTEKSVKLPKITRDKEFHRVMLEARKILDGEYKSEENLKRCQVFLISTMAAKS
jgi:hypothetical protein